MCKGFAVRRLDASPRAVSQDVLCEPGRCNYTPRVFRVTFARFVLSLREDEQSEASASRGIDCGFDCIGLCTIPTKEGRRNHYRNRHTRRNRPASAKRSSFLE